MARVNPVQLQRYLSGMNYPARRQDLLAQAEQNQADERALSSLERLPDEVYTSPADVSAALRQLTADDAQRSAMEMGEVRAEYVAVPPEQAMPTVIEPPAPPRPPSRAAAKAQQLVTTQLNSQKEKLAETLQTATMSIRQAGQNLRQQGQESFGNYVDQGAERLDQISSYLRQTDAEVLMQKAQEATRKGQETARKRPALLIGAGFIAAFVAARLVKSAGEPPPPDPAETPATA